MDTATEKKIIDLIPSAKLKEKINEIDYKFNDENLMLIIDVCSKNFARRNKLFEEFSISSKEEYSNYAIECVKAYNKIYDDFKTLNDGEGYHIVISWAKNADGYNYPSKEEYVAESFDDIVCYINNFYRHAHLAGTNKREKATYKVEKVVFCDDFKNTTLSKRKFTNKNMPFALFDSEKNLIDIFNISNDFPSCTIKDGDSEREFSLVSALAEFPDFVKNGDIISIDSHGKNKYFVAVNNFEATISSIQIADLENEKLSGGYVKSVDEIIEKGGIYPAFANIISEDELPLSLKNNYKKVLNIINH